MVIHFLSAAAIQIPGKLRMLQIKTRTDYRVRVTELHGSRTEMEVEGELLLVSNTSFVILLP